MASVLMVLGFIIVTIGSVLFIIAAFSESLLWGIGCLIFGPLGILFLISHWEKAKTPFFIQLAGFALMAIGSFMG